MAVEIQKDSETWELVLLTDILESRRWDHELRGVVYYRRVGMGYYHHH